MPLLGERGRPVIRDLVKIKCFSEVAHNVVCNSFLPFTTLQVLHDKVTLHWNLCNMGFLNTQLVSLQFISPYTAVCRCTANWGISHQGIPTCFFVSRPREGSFSASWEEEEKIGFSLCRRKKNPEIFLWGFSLRRREKNPNFFFGGSFFSWREGRFSVALMTGNKKAIWNDLNAS